MPSGRDRDTFRTPVMRCGRAVAGICLAVSIAGPATAVDGPVADGPRIHGVKLYLNQNDLQARYPDYDSLVAELRGGGVDALFTTVYEGKTAFYASRVLPQRNPAVDVEKLRRSARTGRMVFGAICHIFFDADTLTGRPDLVPLDQYGDGRFVNWQTFVCPSDAAYRAYKLEVVREVARTLHPDILSLDFMRFPTTWEIIPADAEPGALRNFCFCDRCLSAFQRATGVVIPPELETTSQRADWILRQHGQAWERWKTETITSFVAEASRLVREIDPTIRISVHVVPWREQVFDRGLLRVAGQDVVALAPHVDYLSPMIYHKLIGRPLEDIAALTAELHRKSGRAILPSVQAAQIESEGELTADEFRAALAAALAPPSAGVLVYQWKELMPVEKAGELHRQKSRIFREAGGGAAAARPPGRPLTAPR